MQVKVIIGALNQAITLIVQQLNSVKQGLSTSKTPIPPPEVFSHLLMSALHQHIKPAPPNDFTGTCAEGQTFLNSCEIYFALAPYYFAGDHISNVWDYCIALYSTA